MRGRQGMVDDAQDAGAMQCNQITHLEEHAGSRQRYAMVNVYQPSRFSTPDIHGVFSHPPTFSVSTPTTRCVRRHECQICPTLSAKGSHLLISKCKRRNRSLQMWGYRSALTLSLVTPSVTGNLDGLHQGAISPGFF